jgi:sensor histidine kinase YesM
MSGYTPFLIKYYRLPLMVKIVISVFVVLLLTYSIEIIIFVLMVPKSGSQDMTFEFNNLVKGFGYFIIANLIVSVTLILLFEFTRKKVIIKWWHVLLLLVICFPASLASKIIYTILRSGFSGEEFVDFSFLSGLANYPSLLNAMLAYGLTVYWEVARKEHENALEAKALLKDARWQMLRYQVNPHFLFNSLNSIIALINRDKDLARSMVNELASYFRYTLSWNDLSVISVQEEIKAVSHYLEIQKIRFEDKLNYHIEIDETVLNIQIPIFGLQTLVENAVKYGLKTYTGIVDVVISVTGREDFCVISVSNSGKLWQKNGNDKKLNNSGTGTGLSNLKGRLELLYGGKSHFQIEEENDKVIASIKIPYGPITDKPKG